MSTCAEGVCERERKNLDSLFVLVVMPAYNFERYIKPVSNLIDIRKKKKRDKPVADLQKVFEPLFRRRLSLFCCHVIREIRK